MLRLLQVLDEKLILAINGVNSPFMDSLMWWISGKFSWWPLYLILIALIFWKHPWRQSLMILGFVIFLIALSDQTSVHLFKNVFQRPRPSHNPALENILHYVNNYKGGAFGFISSHASNTFSVALFLILIFRNKYLSISLIIWAILVGYSRIYLGVHYFTDVFAGALWGSFLASITYILYLKIKRYALHTE
ncbi:MAG: phosphatase PAP2 family protein [Bacteroidales bacterium]|nr:phosphatase PAP2 family protein [Bacteroidales bacterium]MCF8390223.1 phosphatase PAP2 family protein [Bacteroidales bacterium]